MVGKTSITGLAALAFLMGGCVQQSSQPKPLPVAPSPVACSPDAVLNEGLTARAFPAQCQGDPELLEQYVLGRRIADLEVEVYELDLLRKDAPLFRNNPIRYGLPRGSYYTGIWMRKKNELKSLKRRAGLIPCAHCAK